MKRERNREGSNKRRRTSASISTISHVIVVEELSMEMSTVWCPPALKAWHIVGTREKALSRQKKKKELLGIMEG